MIFKLTLLLGVGASQVSADGFEIVLNPVLISGSKENESFYHWTPGGQVTLMTANADAANEFEYGKPYYFDFTKAE